MSTPSKLELLRCASQLSRLETRNAVCPECGARPGEHCVGVSGYRESNHKSRAIARAREILTESQYQQTVQLVPSRKRATEFICDICGAPVHPSAGIVHHSLAEAALARPVSDLRWRIGHTNCFDEIPEDYAFPLRQFADSDAVLRWFVQIAYKSWFDAYDWATFIERHFVRNRDAASAA